MGPYFIKTHNSLQKSLLKIEDIITYANQNNIASLGIVDENLYGAMDFYLACKKNNIQPIIGLNIKGLYLFAKNYEGYQNLLKLTTIEDPTYQQFIDYKDNLVCILSEQMNNKFSSFQFYENIYKGYTNYDMRLEINDGAFCNEVLYLKEEDFKYYKYLNCIQNNAIYQETTIKNNNNYFDNYKLYENLDLSKLCNLEMKFNQDILAEYPCEDSHKHLKQLILDGLKNKIGTSVPKVYIERLKYELNVIIKMGFSNYFLIVYDYVKYAKDNGIMVGAGRGSAASSLIAYCLNITTIDPIKYNLLFERFLNTERITMPDIDIDFEYTRRDEVIKYIINKYGLKKVAPIITFNTLGSKQAIRDTAKTLLIDIKKVDYLCKMLDSKQNLSQNYTDEVKQYLTIHKELKLVYEVAIKLEGLKRHTSIHAAGVVMCKYNLDTIIPLKKNNDYYLTGYSMEHLEKIGLLKMDLLALKNLTLLNTTLKECKLKIEDIKLDDKKTLQLFEKGHTLGIFQFEGEGMIKFLKKLKANTFNDIIAAIALYRPGPMQFIDTYIKRKKGEPFTYITPQLKPILKDTYGIIIYQEQIMQIATTMAGYTLAEADILRKAISKKDEITIIKEKETFINKSVRKGNDLQTSSKVFDHILKFASYGFNKAHSVSYAMIAYYMCYLKANYPSIFFKNLLTITIGSETKTYEYIKEYDGKILKPNINKSTTEYIIDQEIITPFTNIKGVGSAIGKIIIDERNNGLFKDIFDFYKRLGPKLNESIIKNLTIAGCFEDFNYNCKTLDQNYQNLINYSELGSLISEDLKPIINQTPEYDKEYLYQKQLEVFGYFLSQHPCIPYKKQYDCTNLIDIKDKYNQTIICAILIENFKSLKTKNNTNMAFITATDESSTEEFVMFDETYIELNKGDLCLIKGKVTKRFDKIQIIINNIKKVNYM